MKFDRPYNEADHGDYSAWLAATNPELERLSKLPESSPELAPAKVRTECRKCGEPLPPGFRVRCAECASE